MYLCIPISSNLVSRVSNVIIHRAEQWLYNYYYWSTGALHKMHFMHRVLVGR